MGKLDFLLNVASLATELAMVGQLQDMRQQGATQAVMQQILTALRNEIFKYNEAHKNILQYESQDLKIAAGAMRLLEYRLRDSGISPDWFSELGDKTYVSDTVRSIQSNASRLTDALDTEWQSEVDELVNKASRINNYNYYLENHTKLMNYRGALDKSKGLGSKSRLSGCLLLLITGLCGGTSFLGPAFAGISLNDSSPVLVCLLPLLIIGTVLFLLGNQGVQAKQTVDKIDQEISMNLMESLDKEFQGNLQEVIQLRDDAQELLDRFFGGSTLLTA